MAAELEIRPTMRFIKLGYLGAGALLAAALVWWGMEQTATRMAAVIAAALLMAWPAARHVKRQRVRCRLEGSSLRYEEGLFSTIVKSVPISNIQDVTVRRGAMQRIWGVGDIRIETAGHGSGLEIANVEAPQEAADRILAARGGGAK